VTEFEAVPPSGPQPAPDDALLAAARAGSRDALETLLERHQAQVYRFGMRMCRHPEDAQDVVQDTLLAMARGVRDFRGASSLSTWLYTIARSFCIKKRRRSPQGPGQELAHPGEDGASDDVVTGARRQLEDPGQNPYEVLAGRQVKAALEQAIAALEPKYREVLLLRDAEGLTAPEVAEVLGLTPQAVKSRLHRARLSVRDQVAPLLGIEPALSPSAGVCPDVLLAFSKHLEGDISAELCAQMEQHMEGCARCRGTCDTLKRTLVLCRTSGSTADVPGPVRAKVKAALRAVLADSSGNSSANNS
jgi:RNA polymerase sigma-70 factor, ECF subfamily